MVWGLRHTHTSLADGGCGERRGGGMEGQRDSCPPAGAGRDRHAPRHARASDLAAFRLADAGIRRRHRALPALPFAWVFAQTIARGVVLFVLRVWGYFLIFYYYFSFVFISVLSFGTPLACPWPPPPQHCSLLLSPNTNPPPQNRVRKLRFPGGSGLPEGGARARSTERAGASISVPCLVSLPPFKPTYESNEGADSRSKARAAHHY